MDVAYFGGGGARVNLPADGDVRAGLKAGLRGTTHYAIFAGDDYYHLVRAQSAYTLCGLPTLRRDTWLAEYRPPARGLPEAPPAGLYRSCPRYVAENNSAKTQGGAA